MPASYFKSANRKSKRSEDSDRSVGSTLSRRKGRKEELSQLVPQGGRGNQEKHGHCQPKLSSEG